MRRLLKPLLKYHYRLYLLAFDLSWNCDCSQPYYQDHTGSNCCYGYILCVAVAVSLGDIGAVGHTREVGLLATRELLRYLKVIRNPAEFARTSINNFVKQLWGRSNIYMKLKHRPSETRNCFDSPFGFSSVGLSLHGLPTVMKYSRWPTCLHTK